MPLSNCPDCGREVSTRARHCVHCGRPWPAARGGAMCALVLGAILAMTVLAGAVLFKSQCVRKQAWRCKSEVVAPAAPVAPACAPAKVEKEEE